MMLDLGNLGAPEPRPRLFDVGHVFEELRRIQLRGEGHSFSQRLHTRYEQLIEEFNSGVVDTRTLITRRGHSRFIDIALLPPNLHGYEDQVSSADVFDFVEQSAIPVYGVPRGNIAVRLIKAGKISERRRILNTYSAKILDDCEAVISAPSAPSLDNLKPFAEEGLAATRAGFAKAAQALFTTTLDTLLSRVWDSDKAVKRELNHRKRDGVIPGEFEELTVREALVWLPVWNAHSEYWVNQNFPAPYEYSRHASIHHVSGAQYSQRNCIQVAMLVSSIFAFHALDR